MANNADALTNNIDDLDISLNFKPDEVNKMKRLVEINNSIKALEKEKKGLSISIKQTMLNVKVHKVAVAGCVLSVDESQRTTVTKSTKDMFVAELVEKGLNYLIVNTLEPNMEDVMQEVSTGVITMDFVNKYVKVTPIFTLRCT